MEKTIVLRRNKVFLSITLSIFIFSVFFLNYSNVFAVSGSCGWFGSCGTAVGCCGSKCCRINSGSCAGNSCAPPTTTTTAAATTTTTKSSGTSCAPGRVMPHWGCSNGQCIQINTCAADDCSSCTGTTTSTNSGSGNCVCINADGSGARYCWDTINNKCCTGCKCEFSCNSSSATCSASNGGYLWSSSCESNCYNGYNCTSGGSCVSAFLGTYTSLSGCQACCGQSCGIVTYYSCNTSTWTCSEDSSGNYSSSNSCNNHCNPSSFSTTTTTTNGATTTTTNGAATTTTTLPETQPCMINYFELPERAWVGYPITGRWSASDWCDDCDVSCTPYPECVWKKDSIGTGFDEDKFTIEQSGTYYYTLTCYGPGGIDERTEPATVKALNLPWWREIIPVLQGFLGGV